MVVRETFALALVCMHLFLAAAAGQPYAKLRFASLYVTELVLVGAVLLAWSAIWRVLWDTTTKLVVAFVALGTLWVMFFGLGPLAGAGAKAFSFFVYAGFYFVLRATATSESRRWAVIGVVAVAAVAGAVHGIVRMHLGLGGETSTGGVRYLGGDSALNGQFAVLIVGVSWILTRKTSAAHLVVLGAGVAELIFAQHRSGFVALAAALIATALLLAGSPGTLRGIVKVAVSTSIGLGIVVWLFGGAYFEETLFRLSHTTDLSEGTIAWRLLSWYEVSVGVIDKPWGHGFATWDFAFTRLGVGHGSDPLIGSHNCYLDLTYRIGVQGLALFLAIPIALILGARAKIRAAGASSQRLLIISCGCLIAFLVYASFNVLFEIPYMSIFFWVFLAIGAGSLEVSSVSGCSTKYELTRSGQSNSNSAKH